MVARQRRLALVLPGLIVVAGGLVLVLFDGGFPPTVWYPAALFALVLLTVTVIAARLAPPARVIVFALAAYALFTAFAFISIAWADAPGEAWQAANRVLLYGLVLALVTMQPWDRAGANVATGLAGFGLALIAAGVLVVGVVDDNPASMFLGGRLAEPAGYLNATANLWLIGFWPALHFATRPGPVWSRALALSAATLLIEMQLLSQSRGAVIAFVATAIVYLLITPRRWPTLLALGATLGLTALAFNPLVDVRDTARAADLGAALDDAAVAIVLSVAAAFAIGVLATLAGGRARPALTSRPWVPRAGNWALVAIAACAVVAILVAIGNPRDWVDARWDDFKNSGYSQVESGRTRFTGGLGSNRYDFYRVTLDQFDERPALGVGGDNFADAYLEHRRSLEAPRYPHSTAFAMISQYGVVGTLLFVLSLGAMTAAVLRARARSGVEGAAVVATAFAAFVAFFLHSQVDWLWNFPGLGVIAFAMLGLAARVEDTGDDVPAPAWRLRLPARVALSVLVLAAAVSLASSGIAARYTAAAYDDYRTDPHTALARLDRAADLNPLSDEPLVAKGVIEQRLGRPRLAIAPLRSAIERRPGNWFSHLELGLAQSELGRSRQAVASLEEAGRLNPRQPLVHETLMKARKGEQINAVAVERELYRGLQDRLRATDPDAASHAERDVR